MTKFGFKEINQNNWLEPDGVLKAFVKKSPYGKSEPITGNDLLNHILKPKLLESVPENVQALFEVARGALAYGYLFYPLYTLAAEQLFRVTEAALSYKCKALGAPESIENFAPMVSCLVNERIIPSSEFTRWDAIRKLRNFACHPESQSILTPGNAIKLLEGVAGQINFLFSSS